MISLIDTHIHFDDDRFDDDRDTVFRNAAIAGVSEMIIPATTQRRWDKIFAITEKYKNTYPTAGLHPLFIEEHKEAHLLELESRLQHPACVAVGECGLDSFGKAQNNKKQTAFLIPQIELAAAYSLPLIVHARNTVQEVTLAIKSIPKPTTGVFHSYNGSLQQATQLIDLGFLLSFGGAITYKRATRLRNIVKALPLDALMVETDAPDQPGHSHNGERNEPAYLPEVIKAIAEIKNLTPLAVAEASNENARQLFNLPQTDHH